MASHEPGQCCTVGIKHEGDTKGKMQTIDGVETYIATPTKSHAGKAILVATDVMGHIDKNSQYLADQFAANGYLAHVPDLFKGDPAPRADERPPNWDLQKWLKGAAAGGEGEGHLPPQIEPIIKSAIKNLREKEGIQRVGIAGYCLGVKFVILALIGGYADAGYGAHPSFVEEDELRKIQGPLSIAAAETDAVFPPQLRHRSEEVLKETKQPYQINLFSSVSHGFAARGAIDKPMAKFAKEQAFLQAVHWFDLWL